MVSVSVAVPPGPVQVRVYVVVVAGVTVSWESGQLGGLQFIGTVPMPGEILQEAALEVDQESVEDSPGLMKFDVAPKLMIEATGVGYGYGYP